MSITAKEFDAVIEDWQAASKETMCFINRPGLQGQETSYPGYLTEIEVVFEPARLDQGRLEIWRTTEGDVAIGVETWGRVGQRLGARPWRSGFAIGHEPQSLSIQEIERVYHVVRSGQFTLDAAVLFGVLTGIRSRDLKINSISRRYVRTFCSGRRLSYLPW